MSREPITPEGLKRLRAEIQRIKAQDRPQVIQAIAEARAHGDLKENAEYHAAKEKQGLLEARLRELENLLASAQVIDTRTIQSTKVTFGATVTIMNLDSNEERVFQIVGKYELSIKDGKIPVSSPLAKVLIGKSEGEQVTLRAPKGMQEYEILKVEFI
ncbi:MAG: transcription elongation factor GreA [Deltaproteobacteria bacterium]|nr:transcription elongation factor GreA [Deltaproteobacteria bacterium]